MIGGMDSMDELVVVCHPEWMFEELAGQGVVPVRRSYGLDVPAYDAGTAWWVPQAVAAHFVASGAVLQLVCPEPDWLDAVPAGFLGRSVRTVPVSEFLGEAPFEGNLFCKLATAKCEGFPAGVRSWVELVDLVRELSLPHDSVLQFSEVIDVVEEFRFFVDGGRVLTGSPYLVDGVTYYDAVGEGFGLERFADAGRFCEDVLVGVGELRPLVVDVGWSASVGFFVLEVNPAWASAWYGCDVSMVVECLLSASAAGEPVRLDSLLMVEAGRKRPLLLA